MSADRVRLHTDTDTLFNVYCLTEYLTAKDIMNYFHVGETKAYKVIKAVKSNGKMYPTLGNEIPTTALFEYMGWNIQDIAYKQKLRLSIGG